MENKNKIVIGSLFHGNYSKKLIDYLLKIAYPDKNIEWNDTEDCDLIIRSVFIYENRKLDKIKKPWIAWTGEPRPVQYNSQVSKPIMKINTFKDSGENTFHVPFMVFSNFDYNNIKRYTNLDRPYLAAYCYSNPVPMREKIFKLFREKDTTVHGIGRCNTTKGFGKAGTKWRDNPNYFKDYRFVIAMENKNMNGYVTEKILNAYIAGAIPIYWGNSSYVKELFNPLSFIDVSDFSCIEACVEYVLDLDKDEERRKMIASIPLFKDNKVPDILRIGDLENVPEIYQNMADIIKETLEK
jgi:hypothetical protein